MYYSSRAIILKNRDFKEADRLITVFTEKQGKVTAVAKGVKKPGSSLRACTQPFCHSFLHFYQGKELDLITQGQILNFFGNSREDIKRTLYMVYFMEILDKSLMERYPLPGLYKKVGDVLEIMNNSFNPLYARYFELQVLAELGFAPMLTHCAVCGAEALSSNYFSISQGGVICDHCRQLSPAEFLLQPETKSLLRMLLQSNLNLLSRVKLTSAANRQLEVFAEKYLEYYLERKFSLKNAIRSLKTGIFLPD